MYLDYHVLGKEETQNIARKFTRMIDGVDDIRRPNTSIEQCIERIKLVLQTHGMEEQPYASGALILGPMDNLEISEKEIKKAVKDAKDYIKGNSYKLAVVASDYVIEKFYTNKKVYMERAVLTAIRRVKRTVGDVTVQEHEPKRNELDVEAQVAEEKKENQLGN